MKRIFGPEKIITIMGIGLAGIDEVGEIWGEFYQLFTGGKANEQIPRRIRASGGKVWKW